MSQAAAEPKAPAGELLGPDFYERPVLEVARDLVGCTLRVGGVGGVIVETEGYHASEPACHAYVGLTERTAPLFGPPGHAYVYLSYGIHALLNAVAEPEGTAAAVLIRAVEPVWGIEAMRARRGRDELHELCTGPGRLTEALGVRLSHNRRALTDEPFELRAPEGPRPRITAGPRVGITKATELPWRFCVEGSRFVSRPRPGARLRPPVRRR